MNALASGDPKHNNGTKSYSMRPPAGEGEEHVDGSYTTRVENRLQLWSVVVWYTHK